MDAERAAEPGAATTIAGWVEHARALGVARLDAERLLGQRLGRTRAWLIAHDDEALAPADAAALLSMLRRRAAGEPLAYLLGEREFHGLALRVTPAVLVPRPETELLVDWALELAAQALASDERGCDAGPAAVDLGTGSGAIALAFKHRAPGWTVTATDASTAALAVAAGNARRLDLEVAFVCGDWWQPLAGRRFLLALANPPYVAAGDPHLAALGHEPAGALTPGADGVAALRRIVADAPAHLQPGAWLLLEHGHDQGGAVRGLLRERGFAAVQTRRDLAGLERCTGGQWPGR